MTTITASAGPPARAHLSIRQRAALASEILIAYGHVRRCMQRHRLPETVTLLRRHRSTRFDLPLPDPHAEGRRLGDAVTRTLALVPAQTACLIRSLVLLRMLAARGVTADLVIAALPSEAKPLDAHAWVELEGRPLLRPEPTFGRLITL